jgi:hypothetical protein
MESYLQMEPDARPVSDGNGESENMEYKEIVQMKQDASSLSSGARLSRLSYPSTVGTVPLGDIQIH